MTPDNRRVGFGDAISLFFKNYVNFQGRSSVGAYWWLILFSVLAGIVLGAVDGAMAGGAAAPVGPLTALYSLATLIPSLAIGVRRLHDTDKSGWWLLLAFIPLVGAIVLIVFFCGQGTRGDNKFGPDVEAGRA
jgi:uncharacterized membrane protein YhaH (DUF805 family)